MSVDWFFGPTLGDGEGPFDADALRTLASQGRINPDDWVWRGTTSKSARASQVKGLFSSPALRFACGSCQRVIVAQPRLAGKTAICPGCGKQVQVPNRAQESIAESVARRDNTSTTSGQAEALPGRNARPRRIRSGMDCSSQLRTSVDALQLSATVAEHFRNGVGTFYNSHRLDTLSPCPVMCSCN